MQDQHRIHLLTKSITDKGQIAAYRHGAEPQHCAHAKGQENESGGQITDGIDQCHDFAQPEQENSIDGK